MIAVVLIVSLGVLAALQIHLINQVVASQEQHMRGELEHAARRMSEEITTDVFRVISAFETRENDARTLAARYDHWRITARDARLIADIYVTDGGRLFRFNRQRSELEPSQWSAWIARFRDAGNRHTEVVQSDMPAIVIAGSEGRRTIILLNAAYFFGELVPAVALRNFATQDESGFDVAVVRGESIDYRSNPKWPLRVSGAQPDLTWPLLPLRHRGSEEVASAGWVLLARHHGQPLAAVMASGRRRHIAIVFAVVLLLGASIVFLAVLARRSEKLRRQQLEFVAGITHELHTPLAALASAGQNLADGLPVDTAKYGNTIVKETRRLIDLVDEVLQFGGIQSRGPLRQEIVGVRAAIDDAIAQCRWLAEESGVKVESSAPETLPDLRGDRAAMTRAVQNLVANAIRHGREGGWVGVRAAPENGFVVITVEDRGPGIAATDLPHLFEPFYRGRNAQTRGSGLGLTIVDRVARAHGGSVTVTRRRERGAEFTLRLPSA